ncbi:MAG: pyridoxal-phosphate dependent enzyme, partial [Clostridiales bacterium]
VGSGGTVSGVGRYLKQYCAPVCIVALEPASSAVLSGAPAGAHPIQGIGAGFVPSALDRSVVDEVLAVEGADAFETARRMMREEGISCGISSGANVWGALQLAAQQRFAGTKIVTVVCDSAERYLSTALFTD